VRQDDLRTLIATASPPIDDAEQDRIVARAHTANPAA
jgi:hypothetical protein